MYKKVQNIWSLLTKTKLNCKKHPLISDLKIYGEYYQQRLNHVTKVSVQLPEECTTIRRALEDVFKLHTFRSTQLQTINAVLSKKDVLMIAPSGKIKQLTVFLSSDWLIIIAGGGKSLCFQLPAIVNPGFTLVISPLVALMQNQVWKLKGIGINAEYLSSTNDTNENNFILEKMICNDSSELHNVLGA